jgi:hypothetical protein
MFDFGYKIDHTTGTVNYRTPDGKWHSRILPPRAMKRARQPRGDEIEPCMVLFHLGVFFARVPFRVVRKNF